MGFRVLELKACLKLSKTTTGFTWQGAMAFLPRRRALANKAAFSFRTDFFLGDATVYSAQQYNELYHAFLEGFWELMLSDLAISKPKLSKGERNPKP